METTQHAAYPCRFCGRERVKRVVTGIWKCRGCAATTTGGAYVLNTSQAITTRSNVRRLREQNKA